MMKENLSRAESYQRLKAQVLLEIESGKLAVAIKAIKTGINSIQDKELRDIFRIICHDYHKWRLDVIKGLLNKDEEAIQRRKIINRILELFDNYEELQCLTAN